jgi:hypothetical protein
MFAGVVAVVEDVDGAGAVARSRALAARVRHLVAPVYAGALVTAIITLGMAALLSLFARFVPNEGARLIIGAVLAFISLMGSAVTISGLMNGQLARALIYDAARRANGERVRQLPPR